MVWYRRGGYVSLNLWTRDVKLLKNFQAYFLNRCKIDEYL